MTTYGYLRCSTSEQNDSGLGMAAQQAAILRSHPGAEIVSEVGSGRALAGRPVLEDLLDRLGANDSIVVARLDRLSRSLLDFAGIMGRAQSGGWNLVCLDLGIDLSTPAGEFLASVMASAAQWERRIIGLRTKEALAAARAAGTRLGRPLSLSEETREEIRASRARGMTWQAVADQLVAAGVPTARGGRWTGSTARQAVAVVGAGRAAARPDRGWAGGDPRRRGAQSLRSAICFPSFLRGRQSLARGGPAIWWRASRAVGSVLNEDEGPSVALAK
jgi:DNA invertase Pin-like site-specific DNA recombinase